MNRKQLTYLGKIFIRSPILSALLLCLFACTAAEAQTKQPSYKAHKYPFKVKVTGHGRPMILIPGLYSSGQVWESTVARYQGNYECHVLTLAGLAGEPPATAPSLENGCLTGNDF